MLSNWNKTTLVLVALVVCQSLPAYAEIGTMVCTNPRREYLVQFDTDEGRFTVMTEEGSTEYDVKSVSVEGRGYLIKGDTVEGGPQFEARTYGKKRIRFYSAFELIQTDFCK